MVFNHFARAFTQFDPDLIVSVHPLLQHVPVRRRTSLAPSAPGGAPASLSSLLHRRLALPPSRPPSFAPLPAWPSPHLPPAPLSASRPRHSSLLPPQLRVLARRKAQTGQEQPPFATVVTDLTSCHPTWFHKGVTSCFVPTQEARAGTALGRWTLRCSTALRPARGVG